MRKLFVVQGARVAFWFVGGRSSDYPYDQTLLVLRDLFALLEQKELLFVDRFACYSYDLRQDKEIPTSFPFQPDSLAYWKHMIERVSHAPPYADIFNNNITMRGKNTAV